MQDRFPKAHSKRTLFVGNIVYHQNTIVFVFDKYLLHSLSHFRVIENDVRLKVVLKTSEIDIRTATSA